MIVGVTACPCVVPSYSWLWLRGSTPAFPSYSVIGHDNGKCSIEVAWGLSEAISVLVALASRFFYARHSMSLGNI